MMQYQYVDNHGNGFQSHKPGRITSNWQHLNVSCGDWFVAYLKTNRFFAVGVVSQPRHDKPAEDVSSTVNKYLHDQRSHDHKNKFVYFTDAPVLYEDLTGKWRHPSDKLSGYALRIDVEQWLHIVPEGIEMQGLLKHTRKKPHLAVTEIDEPFFRRIETQLKKSQSSSVKASASSEFEEVTDDEA